MPTVDYTLLNGSTNGFTNTANGGFDTVGVISTLVYAVEDEATPADTLTATFRQGATTNKYSDWGVPSGATVTGIKLLGAYGNLLAGATASCAVQFWTDEADLGSYDIGSITESGVISLTKTANDYVRVQIDLTGTVTIDVIDPYESFEAQVGIVQIQITYDLAVDLSGSISGQISYGGTLQVGKRLDGAISSSIAYAGTLSLDKQLAGAVSSSIAYTGTLENVEAVNLAGAIVSSIAYAGTLSVAQEFAGAIESLIAYAGTLTNNDPNNVTLGGGIISSVEYAGTLSLAQDFSGNVASSIEYAGTLINANLISGAVSSSIAYAGTFDIEQVFSGSVSGSIAYAGTLTTRDAYEPVGQLRSILLGQGISKSILIANDTKGIMGNTFYVKKGDTAQTIRTRLKDDNGEVNLTACTVLIQFRTKGASTLTLEKTATVDSDQTANTGEVYYTFVSGDYSSLVVGEYQVEWKVTFPDSTVRNFPTSRIPARSYNYLTVYDNF